MCSGMAGEVVNSLCTMKKKESIARSFANNRFNLLLGVDTLLP
jgi:hypothetical protein